MLDASRCPGIASVKPLSRGGASYGVYAVLAVLYALVGRQLIATVGEPYRTAMAQQDRIEASRLLIEGSDARNLISLQSGLTKAADIPTVNASLFDDSRALLRGLRPRMEALTAAFEVAKPDELATALGGAIELHSDGRPFVDRYHIRQAAKKLQQMVRAQDKAAAGADDGAGAAAAAAASDASASKPEPGPAEAAVTPLFERVTAALELARGSEEEAVVEEEEERKLPHEWMPSFVACLLAFVVVLLSALVRLAAYWSVEVRALMYFHGRATADEGALLKLVPPRHRGKPEIVPVKRATDGRLLFKFQRQQYELLADEAAARPLLCPTELPLAEYAAAEGLGEREVTRRRELYGANSFDIPLPSFGELYKQQITSPIACFQLFCSVLWLLDEYWKYTLFTLFMILTFEATTAFSRQKNMTTLRGMSAAPTQLLVWRGGAWKALPSTELLPSDLVSLKRQPGNESTLVPADCLLLRGRAVVNESTLTGESVPQMKDALPPTHAASKARLDMRGEHRVHVLFSGTQLMQHGGPATVSAAALADGADGDAAAAAAAAAATPNAAAAPDPPDGGCVCYVLATSFASSQGELMRMIEFSTEQVSADKKETLGLLLLLLCFALSAATYVIREGLAEGKKSHYELLLKAVLIITSVVPPELPMQTALAVNTALMALMKAQVFCTEPYRVPYAGTVTHTFFDKTGTLTTDSLIAKGVVNNPKLDPTNDGIRVGGGGGGSSGKDGGVVAGGPALQPSARALQEVAVVIGGCQSLLQVDGRLLGDPIELAALRAIGWDYDAEKGVARAEDSVAAKEKALKEAEAKAAALQRQGDKASAADNRKAADGVEEARKAIARAERRRDNAAVKGVAVRPVQRHHFSSALQRMSTVAHVSGLKGDDGRREEAVLCLVKGSPEAIGKLLHAEKHGGKPGWYDPTHQRLSEQGLRVLALAYKRCACDGSAASEAQAYARKPREWVESGLTFAGFIAFGCPVRKDSRLVIGGLVESGHSTHMLTGDAALTAIHVAKEVGMLAAAADDDGSQQQQQRPETSDDEVVEVPRGGGGGAKAPRRTLLLTQRAADFAWVPALGGGGGGAASEGAAAAGGGEPFSVAGVPQLRARGHGLVVTGSTWDALTAAEPAAWSVAGEISVFARMSPEGKEAVLRAMRDNGKKTLMCGDGGNDVGALKSADVGVSLLTGFGNANVDLSGGDKKEGADNKGGGGGGGKGAEAALDAQTKDTAKKRAEANKKVAAEFNVRKAELAKLQPQWLKEEMDARAARGETGVMAQFGAMPAVAKRMQAELAKEKQMLAKKHGAMLAGGGAAADALADMEDLDVGTPMVKLGDASIAAPFTSKLASIRSCLDIIRQGHCTLVSTVQQQQILMLHCMISAYSLSALSLDGSRASEQQLIASGMLLSCASIAFSFAKPLDRLSHVLPLSSIFHPALILSVLGQLLIHASCMLYALRLARAHMGEAEVREVIKLQKQADKLYEAGDEEAASKAHKPNLLNTVVWLVETAQQVAVMLVNYKGRPWMKGATENPGLLYSLALCVAGVVVAAWELVPQLNEYLGLIALPSDEARYELLALLAVTLLGSFVWDRLCLAIFAPRLFAAQLKELAELRAADFVSDKTPRNVGLALLVGAWLYFTEGNMLYAGVAYMFYKRMYPQPPPGGQQAGGTPPAAQPAR